MTSVAPPRTAARAESSASFTRASASPRVERPRSRFESRFAPDAERRPGRVEGDEAAADHDDPAAEIDPVALVHVEQVVDGLDDAVELDARDLQVAPARDADGQKDGLESLPAAAPRGRSPA